MNNPADFIVVGAPAKFSGNGATYVFQYDRTATRLYLPFEEITSLQIVTDTEVTGGQLGR